MRSSLLLSFAAPALVAAGLVAAGCDSTPARDAGVLEAGMDASRPDAGRDAGPLCTLECEGTEDCCFEPGGAMVCTNTRGDIHHCGRCSVDCEATGRGDSCRASQCACGDFDIGCLGERASFCCPPREGGGSPYCANLERDLRDCDTCGHECDPTQADRCFGGSCVCGEERRPCGGADTDRCCLDIRDVGACVDTRSDTAHCGACRTACGAFERCAEGLCTLGAETCEAGCGEGEMCCRGVCCVRALCERGLCGTDAGLPDAGSDAGSDAGAPDTGPPDAGLDAG